LSMIECVLFDSDGTLVDSERLCYQAMSEKFAHFGVELDPHVLIRRYRGWKLDLALGELSEQHQVNLPAGFEQDYRARVDELFETHLKAMPGVTSVLPRLPQDKAVVSSGPMAKIRKALSVTGLSHHFMDQIYSSYEIGIWKPDPGIYTHAAGDMGYGVENCIAVEDSPVGVAAAVGSGMKTVFLNCFEEPCEWDNVIEISSMAELPAIVNQSMRYKAIW
jgi:HAD superfamily hydrolase (TIGR01509 family)